MKKRPKQEAETKFTPPRTAALSVQEQRALEQSNMMQRRFKVRRTKQFEQ